MRELGNVQEAFETTRSGRVTICLRREHSSSDLARRLEKAIEVPPAPAARGRAGVFPFAIDNQGNVAMVRPYRHAGPLGFASRGIFLARKRPLRELAVAEMAYCARVPTPIPIGVITKRVIGPFYRAWYVSGVLADSEDAIHFLGSQRSWNHKVRREAVRASARTIGQLHTAGIVHGDLHLKNLILQFGQTGEPRVFVLDFDKSRFVKELSDRDRLRNLARLARSVRKIRTAYAMLTPTDRMRFLDEYLSTVPNGGRLKKCWARTLGRKRRLRRLWWWLAGIEREPLGNVVPSDVGCCT